MRKSGRFAFRTMPNGQRSKLSIQSEREQRLVTRLLQLKILFRGPCQLRSRLMIDLAEWRADDRVPKERELYRIVPTLP